MKLLTNGGLNLSILDGWWDEGYDREVGWAIGNGEEYSNESYQDEVESKALYNLLEKNVAPLFYERDEEHLPRRWIAKMKASMKRLCPVFNTNRMVTEYAERFYLPAGQRYLRLAADRGAKTYPIVEWRRRFRLSGSNVKITQIQRDTHNGIPLGTKLQVTASILLGDIPPEYVRVQIVAGSVNPEGSILQGRPIDMVRTSTSGEEHLYQGEVECTESGSCGFSLRVIPHHEEVIVPYEHSWVRWDE
jgi:starch phosphorylase